MRCGRRFALLVLVASLAAGCMSWKRGWELAPTEPTSADVESLRDRAARLAREADSRESLIEAVEAYETIVAAEPDDLDALTQLSQYYCLLGAAYAESVSEKRDRYRSAIQYAERAIYTNDEFREALVGGASFEEALHVLSGEQLQAVFYWINAVSYYFKECLPRPAYVFNVGWMRTVSDAIAVLLEKHRDWGEGAVYFAAGVYYLGLPERLGGSMETSAEYFEKAIDLGPKSLLHRWGRAKYFATKAGDEQLMESDLQWVVAQDPHQSENPPYPWNVYFQRDAREMLRDAGKTN